MEITDREEVYRLLKSGVLEVATIASGIREIITSHGLEGLASLRASRCGVNLDGQAADWVCPACGAKKFCPVLRLPYHFEVECDAGVLVCEECRHSEVVPVREARWGNFGVIKPASPPLAKESLALPGEAPTAQPELVHSLVISDALPSLAVAAELVRIEDRCQRLRHRACLFVGPASFVRKAIWGEQTAGYVLYSCGGGGLTWFDLLVSPGVADGMAVGRALFEAMLEEARRRGLSQLWLCLPSTLENKLFLADCGMAVTLTKALQLRQRMLLPNK